MPARYAFLVGNGLSAAFDPRLNSKAISERVFARLTPGETSELLRLAELLRPDTPEPALDVARGGFEALAGPLDRMADALLALEGLLGPLASPGPLAALAAASDELRNLYRRIVGIVLAEIDSCCRADRPVADERREGWSALNDFGRALGAKSGDCNPIYTTNYDSLLASALLDQRGALFDGFPGGSLDTSLRCYGSKPSLYHLHGSIGWTTSVAGELAKQDMGSMRAAGIVEMWAASGAVDLLPTVMLGDQKTERSTRFPFVVFYDAFRRKH